MGSLKYISNRMNKREQHQQNHSLFPSLRTEVLFIDEFPQKKTSGPKLIAIVRIFMRNFHLMLLSFIIIIFSVFSFFRIVCLMPQALLVSIFSALLLHIRKVALHCYCNLLMRQVQKNFVSHTHHCRTFKCLIYNS